VDAFSKQPIPLFFVAVSLWLLAMAHPLAAAQDNMGEALRPALVSAELLEAKIAEAEAADVPDEARTELVELYRRAQSNLEEARAKAERTSAFEDAARTAPAQAELVREKIEEAEASDPLATLNISLETPLEEIEQQLQKEQADLAAVTARHAEFERRLATEEDRPAVIRQRLAEASQQQE
jgi:potassium efflux system protein